MRNQASASPHLASWLCRCLTSRTRFLPDAAMRFPTTLLGLLLVAIAAAHVTSADAGSDTCPDPESPTQPREHHRYCIVGAGPAGVQLGTFLQSAGRDFVLLERNARAASFFARYPIHRTLNSINRRYTRRGLADGNEYGLRHDWNSLLKPTGEPSMLFSSRSKEYWPAADDLVEYVNDFAAPMEAAGALRFGTNVTKVAVCGGFSRLRAGKKNKCRYVLTTETTKEGCATASRHTYTCSVLVMANGMWRPRAVEGWIEGLADVSVSYDELWDVPADAFENKSVMILGAGNAATETADAIRNYARDILMVSRSVSKQMKDTRYVGHVSSRLLTSRMCNRFEPLRI